MSEDKLPDDEGTITPPTIVPLPDNGNPLSDPMEDMYTQTPTEVIVTPASKSEYLDADEDILDNPSEESEVDLDDDIVASDNIVDAPAPDEDGIPYPVDKIDLRGEKETALLDLFRAVAKLMSGSELDTSVRTSGSWENLLFQAMTEPNLEEQRIREALGDLSSEERTGLASRIRGEDGKTILRTSAIVGRGPAEGEVKVVSGEEALLAFENLGSEKGGGYRIPLYNSGICIDVVVPTGNDIQALLTNCVQLDRELGVSQGGHYFTHFDHMIKTQIIRFIEPLIVNSSYADWRKNGKLWSVIKLPDLAALVMTIAAICYKDGFSGFVTKCTRPVDQDHPEPCKHTETITANLFNMIVTRVPVLSKDSIDFMVAARMGISKHSFAQITKYQEGLGLNGEKITIGDTSFTMHVPSIADHIDAGVRFLSDITNEIEGDNSQGQYEQFGVRYIRTFLPWISSVEKHSSNGAVLKTSEPRVITRELEKIDDRDPDDKLREALLNYVNKTQLTYVGYPATPCPACGYTADTPSGMLTFDPFSAFFILASLYLNPTVLAPPKG